MFKWIGKLGGTQPVLPIPSNFDLCQAARQEGNSHLDAGDLAGAVICYERAVAADARSVDAWTSLGYAQKELRNFPAAVKALRNALALDSSNFDAKYMLGQVLIETGEVAQSVSLFESALKDRPTFESLYGELSHVLLQLGQAAGARKVLVNGLQVLPGCASLHFFFGNLLCTEDKQMEALAEYELALSLDHGLLQAHTNISVIHIANGHLDKALRHAHAALAIDGNSAEGHFAVGAALEAHGDLEAGLRHFEEAILRKPPYIAALHRKGCIHLRSGDLPSAISCFKEVLRIVPDAQETCTNLCVAYIHNGEYQLTADLCKQILARQPDSASALNNLGIALGRMGLLAESEHMHKLAVNHDSKSHVYLENLGGAFLMRGQIARAIDSFRSALALHHSTAAHSNLLFSLTHLGQDFRELALAEAKAYGRFVAGPEQPPSMHPVQIAPRSVMRVGFVSGDFCQHPVGNFIENVFHSLQNEFSDEIEIYAYHTQGRSDEVTERIKTWCDSWVSAVRLSDVQFTKRIQADSIDILIDLSGHTQHNRLSVFARRSAPIQATWLGYLATTGVAAMDFVIADELSFTTEEQAYFTEEVIYLPSSYICFTMPKFASEVGDLPMLRNGFITFGCFNNLTKLGDDVVELWSRLLLAIDGSRLFLKALQLKEATERDSVTSRFAKYGISADRLILEGPVPRNQFHLPFQRVDIALDPFPYPGITTTVENLLMGVPVLCLKGKSFLSRQGYGLLMNANLPDWVANDSNEFVELAKMHASNPGKLANLRSRLREQVASSPIFDSRQFATHFMAGLREMVDRRQRRVGQ